MTLSLSAILCRPGVLNVKVTHAPGAMASELEKQMAELMKGTGDILKGSKEAQQTASKVRRKSRDIEQILQDLPQAEQWKGLVDLLGSDTSDDAIAKLFDEIGATSAIPCHLRC